jgi:hypothetical protein
VDSRGCDDDSQVESTGQLFVGLAELREFLDYYLEVRCDQLRYRIQSAMVSFGLMLMAAIVAASVMATAVVITLEGLAKVVDDATGRDFGQALVGSIVLLTASGGVCLWNRRRRIAQRHRVADKYEHRKEFERDNFGTDVSQRSAK